MIEGLKGVVSVDGTYESRFGMISNMIRNVQVLRYLSFKKICVDEINNFYKERRIANSHRGVTMTCISLM